MDKRENVEISPSLQIDSPQNPPHDVPTNQLNDQSLYTAFTPPNTISSASTPKSTNDSPIQLLDENSPKAKPSIVHPMFFEKGEPQHIPPAPPPPLAPITASPLPPSYPSTWTKTDILRYEELRKEKQRYIRIKNRSNYERYDVPKTVHLIVEYEYMRSGLITRRVLPITYVPKQNKRVLDARLLELLPITEHQAQSMTGFRVPLRFIKRVNKQRTLVTYRILFKSKFNKRDLKPISSKVERPTISDNLKDLGVIEEVIRGPEGAAYED
jgi:hypothetical protein